MTTISIPSLGDSFSDFEILFNIHTLVGQNEKEIIFDFPKCSFLKQNAIAFLGGLARTFQKSGCVVSFEWSSLKPEVEKTLAQNGFIQAFGGTEKTWEPGDFIPYREERFQDPANQIEYLSKNWLGRLWGQSHISPKLHGAIVGRVWELYANAFEHGQSEVGLFVCGQHYGGSQELKLAVCDFGIGIPNNVRRFFKNDGIASEKALQWALLRGTTTKPGLMGRGVGLDILKEFIKLNNGKMQIFSNDGYAEIGQNADIYSTRTPFLQGTLFNITFKCDDKLYHYASEKTADVFF